MAASSPIRFPPSPVSYRPMNSSPLAPPRFSEHKGIFEHRRLQYKSRVPTASTFRHPISSPRTADDPASEPSTSTAISQTALLRERSRAQCSRRSSEARKRAVRGRRWPAGSDGYEMDLENADESEDDEAVVQSEFFRRIMDSDRRKRDNFYRLSFEREAGSSELEPEDLERGSDLPGGISGSYQFEHTPLDLEEEEVAAYAEEHANLSDLENMADQIFSLSDLEDGPVSSQPSKKVTRLASQDMDTGI